MLPMLVNLLEGLSAIPPQAPGALGGLPGFGLAWLAWLAAGVFLFILPGWALLSAVWIDWPSLHPAEKLALAGSLSLALYPLLLLWSDLAGLSLGRLIALAPGLLALAWILTGAIKSRLGLTNRFRKRFRPGDLFNFPQDLAFWIILAAVVLTRIQAVHGLEIPLWGDSYQHTVIAQLIVDRGGLFDDWQPYAEMVAFTYHFGFHAAAAALHWATGLPLPHAILIAGQMIQILAVLTLYPLAARLGRSQWSGLAAIIIAGLLLRLPNVYTHWGRYTQLAGQAILPVAVYLVWQILDNPPQRWTTRIPAWLAVAGLALTHYRVAIFGLFFGLAYFLATGLRTLSVPRARLPGATSSAGFAPPPPLETPLGLAWRLAAGGLFLCLPWLPRLTVGGILHQFARQITTLPDQLNTQQVTYNAFGNPSEFLPDWVWPAAVAAGLWLGWVFVKQRLGARLTISTGPHAAVVAAAEAQRVWSIFVVVLWWGLLLLATNPGWLGLPGSGVISNFAYWIASYLPTALILGATSGAWIEAGLRRIDGSALAGGSPERRLGRWAAVVLACALVFLGLGNFQRRASELDLDAYRLVTSADLVAMDWIRANTPSDARFLVNSFFAYGGAVIAGSDGGWWLPLLAGRSTTQPPLNYGNETGPRSDYIAWVNALPRNLLQKGFSDPQTLAMLRERGVNFIYIGKQQRPAEAAMDVQALLKDGHYQPVYHADGVWVFAINWEP